MRPVILDDDPGVDDALAISLALHSPELEILGLTSVSGNFPLDPPTENTLKVLEKFAMGAGAGTATWIHLGIDGVAFASHCCNKRLPDDLHLKAIKPMAVAAGKLIL